MSCWSATSSPLNLFAISLNKHLSGETVGSCRAYHGSARLWKTRSSVAGHALAYTCLATKNSNPKTTTGIMAIAK
jgi:hypothetical protein